MSIANWHSAEQISSFALFSQKKGNPHFMNHNNNFNFLRIFAAILVCITHSYAITGHEKNEPIHLLTNGFLYLSSIGLYIFFFTSGYLVSYSATHSKSALIYLEKRVLRIYPALIAVVLISVFVAGPLLTSLPLSQYFSNAETWKYLWTATGVRIRFQLPGVFENCRFAMTGFNGSLWSLKLELEMYALLFLIVTTGVMKRKKLSLIMLICLLICFLILSARDQYSALMPDHKNLLFASTFLFGGIMQTNFISKRIAMILLLISAVLLVCKVIRILPVNIMVDEVLFFGLATYFIAFTKWFLIKIKTDISYGIYIYTFPLQQYFFQLFSFSQSTLVNFFFSVFCSGLIALSSWIYLEKPALQLKATLSR